MSESVYIETTIVSYLTARPSHNVLRLAHEMVTREWWALAAKRYALVTSELVLVEAARGDAEAAAARLAVLEQLPLVPLTESARGLSRSLMKTMQLPERAAADALHVAICATEEVPFLLTWNCKHLANGHRRPRIEGVCRSYGYSPPTIVTPEQLLEVP